MYLNPTKHLLDSLQINHPWSLEFSIFVLLSFLSVDTICWEFLLEPPTPSLLIKGVFTSSSTHSNQYGNIREKLTKKYVRWCLNINHWMSITLYFDPSLLHVSWKFQGHLFPWYVLTETTGWFLDHFEPNTPVMHELNFT